MSPARDEILGRIRSALADGTQGRPTPPPVIRDYRGADVTDDRDPEALADLLTDRLLDYKATVYRCAAPDVAATVAAALAERRLRRIVTPAGLDPAWLPGTIEVTGDRPPLSSAQLDQLDGVITSCAVAIAETGTIVLDAGPGQGRRALTLVPDYHLVVVTAERIVGSVPSGLARLTPDRPLTWISGPSATSDIELSRVEGVHGPRTLDVVLVDGTSPRRRLAP